MTVTEAYQVIHDHLAERGGRLVLDRAPDGWTRPTGGVIASVYSIVDSRARWRAVADTLDAAVIDLAQQLQETE